MQTYVVSDALYHSHKMPTLTPCKLVFHKTNNARRVEIDWLNDVIEIFYTDSIQQPQVLLCGFFAKHVVCFELCRKTPSACFVYIKT